MDSRSSSLFRFSFAVFDLLCLNIVQFILILFKQNVLISKAYVILLVFNNAAWIGSAYMTALYVGKHFGHDNFFKRTGVTFLLFIGTSLLGIFLYKFIYPRGFVLGGYIAFGTILFISRTIYIGSAYYMRKNYPLHKKVVLIGYNDLSKKLVDNFKFDKSITVVGFFDDNGKSDDEVPIPVLGNIEACIDYAMAHNIVEIYSTVSPERNHNIYELANKAETNFIRFKFVPDFRMFVNRTVHIDFARNIPVLSLRPEPLQNLDSQIKKRWFDIIFSLLMVFCILSWLVPLMALLIKLESRGPVFFTQLRSGKNNQAFLCYKFRSLKVNDQAHSQQVTKDDDRFTRVGKFLRKTNLDEFPQFINVLRGEMSVVGPRPHMLKHTEEYSQMMNHYMIRHYVKPGVTGWAQINGYRGEIKETKDLRARVEHDIWYMENWNMWLDLRIIVLTAYNTIKGDDNAF